MTLRVAASFGAIGLIASVLPQSNYGLGAYPQFRNLSGLPGGGFGVTPSGEVGIRGAFSYSTPVAYGLAPFRIAIVGGNISPDNQLRWFDEEGRNTPINSGNGTLSGVLGLPAGNFRISISYMVLSSIWDNADNVHIQIPVGIPKLGFAVGVQDVYGRGGATGEGLPGDGANSQSYFTAATYDFGSDRYVTVGFGDTRFRKGFLNASAPLQGRLKGFVEHDGYGWHYGIAFGAPLKLMGDRGQIIGLIGQAEGKYQFWSVGFAF